MTWFKVDDGLPDHPKVLRLQSLKGWQGALSLWTLAGAWSAKHLTDGAVPLAIVTRLGCAKRDAQLLVECGLWVPEQDGYRFHDWTARNPSRSDVEAKREKTRQRVSEWRGNQPRNDVTEDVSNASPVPTIPDHSPLPPAANSNGTESLVARTRRFYAQLLGALGTFPAETANNARATKALADWAGKHSDPVLALRAAFHGFEADEWAKSKGYPLAALASNTTKYHLSGARILENLGGFEEGQHVAH